MTVRKPSLVRAVCDGVAVWTDPDRRSSEGVVIAFTERGGGTSSAPFASLNLAAHVGDDPTCVDENRLRLLDALGLGESRNALTFAEQVHGGGIAKVNGEDAGAGALASGGVPPVPATDALWTMLRGVPLALCFADCVPVILVSPGPGVAVVHAGWRGALLSLPGETALALARGASCTCSEIVAYIGPHIGGCHYEVGDEVMSQFVNTFDTLARAESGGLDLDAVVSASLDRAGVQPCNIARLGTCTAEATERFFSYRAEAGRTGRHAALACIVPDGSS